MLSLNYKTYQQAQSITVIAALILLLTSFILGKENLFLLLNIDWGNTADIFFKHYTNLGDGWWWLLWLVVFIAFRKKYLVLLISTFILSTLFTQGLKNIAFPNSPRPIAAIQNINTIHTVRGVEMHCTNSFPSGHTATAFCFFILLCLMIKNRWILPVGLCYALLAGYSRVYLAQHFPLDVAGGMLAAALSVWLSLLLQKKVNKE